MKTLEDVIEKFPEEWRLPLYEAFNIVIQESKELIAKEEISKIWKAIEELVEIQKKQEQRLEGVENRLTNIEKILEELIQAQKKTEQRVEELAQAQEKTEQKIEELAQAQKRTEEELKALIGEHQKTREMVGGLSETVGYTLENQAYKSLPSLLKKLYKIKVEGKLRRRFVRDNKGNYIEINIIGEGFKNGKKVAIIRESKVKLSKRKVDEFLRKKIKRMEGVFDNIFPLIVTHTVTSPEVEVEEYAIQKGVKIIYSYDL